MPGKFHGYRSLAGTVHGVAKSQTRLSDVTKVTKELTEVTQRRDLPDGADGKSPTCQVRRYKSLPLPGEDPLEKGMATCSRILTWSIPWTEEPGGLQFMGSQRVRHD